MVPISTGEVAVRLGAAVLLCGLIGLERQERHKAAGLRTLILVGVGAAVFVMAALRSIGAADPVADAGAMSRVVQGVIAGVGFLGAGTVLRSAGRVRGMTTAATVWATCAIGVACGLGEIAMAGATAVVVWGTLEGLGWVEKRWMKRGGHGRHRAEPDQGRARGPDGGVSGYRS
jgi:putative Mg2+ transporter-C (MgtC) family protein